VTERSSRPEEHEPVVIRDNRKIDPVTGEPRKPAGTGGAHAAPDPAPGAISSEEDVPKAEALLLEERTRDLQRVSAEYANYRKRAERERLAAGELAVGRTLAELLPVLDDLDRARAHGDLTGALKAVADKLEAVVTKLGLVEFGEPGDPFDPAVHEAVLHDVSDEVTESTATTVMRKGYKHGERLLRPAMVGVTDPAAPTPATAGTEPQGDATPEHELNDTSTTPPEDVAEQPTSEGNPATSSEREG
jgi:molecular chaperone GrpE